MINFLTEGSDLDQKINLFEKLVLVKRISKVTKGGRVFSFSALSVSGDTNGKVGIGKGKAKDVSLAIQKSMANARKNYISISIKGTTLHHQINVKYCSTKIIMMPASRGTGIISSFVVRSIFEAVGISDVFVKCFGSKNPHNVMHCIIKGLQIISQNIESYSFRKNLVKKNQQDGVV
jgi:small subunit ribosomal protein S5